MKNVLLKFAAIALMLLISNFSKAQTTTDKFEGTWALIMPQLDMMNGEKPNFCILKVFDKNGSYSQIRIQNADVIVHQKAKIKISSESTYNETMLSEKEGNYMMPGQTHQIKYSFAKEGNKDILFLEGEFMDRYGNAQTWKEAWRKVGSFIPEDKR